MTGTLGQYQRHLAEYANGNLGAAATLDFHVNGIYQSGVLNSATCALTFNPPREHSTIWLKLIQDATGGRLVTFPGTVVGTAPPLNAAANASTLIALLFNGANYQFVSAVATGVAGVTSFNSRAGAVSPAASDYNATQVTNTSSVTGAFVKDALNTLLASIGALVTGVSSFNTRTGAVSPLSGDYAASQVTNDSSTVSGAHVSNALDNLKASITALVTGVSSFKTRTGAVTPAAGDYAASQVNNDSATVTGTHVSDALDALKALIAASVTGVSSVYGRTGAVIAAVGDYAASKITNDSATVSGAHVSDALDALKALISSSGVISFATRTGAVTPASGDYAASQVTNDSTVIGTGTSGALNTLKAAIAALAASSIGNDSSVTGTTVKDALNTLKTTIAALVTGVSSFNTRTGPVTSASGDYTTTLVTNSSTVTGATGTAALNNLLLEFPNGFYGKNANFTLSNANIGQLGLINAANLQCTIPSLASSGIAQGSKFSLLLYSGLPTLVVVGAVGVTVHVPSGGFSTSLYTRFELECIGSDEWRVTANLLQPDTNNIANASGVTGSSVTDALNTLSAHSFAGTLGIPLNFLGTVSDSPSSFPFELSRASGWLATNTSAYFVGQIGPLPAGLTIDSFSLWFTPASGHGTNYPPANMPWLQVFVAGVGGLSPIQLGSTITDASATATIYETPHALTCSFSPVSTTQNIFFFYFQSEYNFHALPNTQLTYASVHVTP